MKFSSRIFILVFLSNFILLFVSGGSLLYKNYLDFTSDLNVTLKNITNSVSNSITQTDKLTDRLLFSSAEAVIQARKIKSLNKKELILLRDRLHVSDIYIINKSGVYLQSTDSWAETSSFNFFSFCEEYKGFPKGTIDSAHTPILLAYPPLNRAPYKFVQVWDAAHSEIVEIGLKLESITELLDSTLKEHSFLLDVGLYTPKGQKIGDLNPVEPTKPLVGSIRMERKILPTTSTCCQCKTKGLSETSEYWYNLKVNYSDSLVTERINRLILFSIPLLLIAVFLSFIVAKAIASSLSHTIVSLEKNLREIILLRDFTKEVAVKGKDEVSSLSKLFQSLMRDVYFYQQREYSAKLLSSGENIAKSVSDELRAPLANMEIILSAQILIPKDVQTDLKSCLRKIHHTIDTLVQNNSGQDRNSILPLIEETVRQERATVANNGSLVTISSSFPLTPVYAFINGHDFQRAISNMICASVESIEGSGTISVTVTSDEHFIQINISDTGKGVPTDFLKNLLNYGETFLKGYDSGLGLYQAHSVISAAGGQLTIDSNVGTGTIMMAVLPKDRSVEKL